MAIEYNDAKRLALRFLYENKDSNNLQMFTGIPHRGLVQLAESEGITIDQNDDFIIRQAVCEMISQGMVMPGSTNQGTGFPHVTMTLHGVACYESGETVAIDSEGFLSSMDLDTKDEIIKLYTEEAVSCFSRSNYLASAVMVGGAAERTIEVLTTEFRGQLPAGLQGTYDSEVASKTKIKARFDAFMKFLEDNNLKSSLSRTEREKLDGLFHAMISTIRITRNETGHPTGRTIDRDEAQGLVYQLKTVISFTYEFLATAHSF